MPARSCGYRRGLRYPCRLAAVAAVGGCGKSLGAAAAEEGWRPAAQEDLRWVDEAGRGRVDVTVGSALDIFGGQLPYQEVVRWHRRSTG